MVFYLGLKALYLYSIKPLRFKYAKTYYDSGLFLRYDDEYRNPNPSRVTPWVNRWIVIQGKYGKQYRFLYLRTYHDQFEFLKNGLKEGDKVCFDYFDMWIKTHGKTSLKSIQKTEVK